MIVYPNLIPECNIDTAFVEMLGYKEPNHASSINEVSKILENNKSKQRAIGFVDNDKRMPKYLSQFEVVENLKTVKLLKHSSKDHYLVVVNPAMDKFIFDLCKKLDIDLAEYGFPGELKAFISFTKRESVRRNIKNLLNAIKQKNPPEIQKVRFWIAQHSPY